MYHKLVATITDGSGVGRERLDRTAIPGDTPYDRVPFILGRVTHATHPGYPSEEDRAIADVWLSNLVAWVTHRDSATDVTDRLELTVRLLLKP